MSSSRSLGLVVFDLDGVLIDSAVANVEAFRYGLQQVGAESVEDRAILDLVGLPALEMLRRLGCPSGREAEVFERFVKPHYLEHLPQYARAYPGAAELLRDLNRAGYRLAACTSGDRGTQTAALEAIGLWGLLEEMQTPDDSAYGKPDVRYLQEVVERFPSELPLHHIEDSEVGLVMGAEAGAVTYYASYGNGQPTGMVTPDHVLDTLGDLRAHLLS